MPDLPQVGVSHRQERKSRMALEGATPEDLFVVRRDSPDYGNDTILEAQIRGRASNFRAHIQLKSVARPRRTKDGLLSYDVDLRNLRYLLNQPSSLVVLYAVDTEELLWEWARTISSKANEIGVDLMGPQKTFAYRFHRRLDRAGFEEIHSKTLQMACLVKSVVDAVSVGSPGAAVVVEPDMGRVLSSGQAVELLRNYGIGLSNRGRHDQVSWLLALASDSTREDPELSVIAAYAKFRTGEYFHALAYVLQGTHEGLNEGYAVIAEYLRAVLRYLVGLSTAQQYEARRAALVDRYPGSLVSLKIRLENARLELSTADRTERTYREKLTAFEQALLNLSAKASSSPELARELAYTKWEVAGQLLIQDFLDDALVLSGRDALGTPLPLDIRVAMANRAHKSHEHWHRVFLCLLTLADGDPSFESALRTTHARLRLFFSAVAETSLKSSGCHIDDDAYSAQRQRAFDELLTSATKARVLAECCHDFGGELRAELAMAECKYACDAKSEALALATEVKAGAQRLGASDIEAMADALLSGHAIFELGSFVKTEGRRPLAEHEIPKYARQFARITGLPADRLPYIEEDYRWLRAVEIERLHWCRHVAYIQDLTHTLNPVTYFARHPLRSCVCLLHGHETAPGYDCGRAINQLKAFYCLSCLARSPTLSTPVCF